MAAGRGQVPRMLSVRIAPRSSWQIARSFIPSCFPHGGFAMIAQARGFAFCQKEQAGRHAVLMQIGRVLALQAGIIAFWKKS